MGLRSETWSYLTERRVRIGEVSVHDLTVPEILSLIRSASVRREQLTLCYATAHAIRLAAEDPEFRRALAAVDVVFCDSYGVQLASRLLGRPLRGRMTPPTWLRGMVGVLPPDRARFYLLGDETRVLAQAAVALESQFRPASVVGYHHGFFPLEGPDNDSVINAINAAAPSILLVGMGMPRQERWIVANAPRLSAPIVLAVGALFRRITGIERRPHPWIADHGLEWLVRFLKQPRAMFDRYAIGLPKFAAIIGRQWWSARLRPPPGH